MEPRKITPGAKNNVRTVHCGSQNYVWSELHKLGEGSYGAVYKAWHRLTGELVAVKTFLPKSVDKKEMPQKRMQEPNILDQMSHVNIIRLLAVEHLPRGDMVLVMELCEGGSLQDVLNEPENAFGLDETEFMLVLKHLTSGLKYLRDHGFIHRYVGHCLSAKKQRLAVDYA